MGKSKQGIVVSIDLGEFWTGGGVEERILDTVASQLVADAVKKAGGML